MKDSVNQRRAYVAGKPGSHSMHEDKFFGSEDTILQQYKGAKDWVIYTFSVGILDSQLEKFERNGLRTSEVIKSGFSPIFLGEYKRA